MRSDIDLVYVWVNDNAHAPHDLKYSLRSVEEMWLDRYKISIVGDRPKHLTNLYHTEIERAKSDFRPKALDAVKKMRAICSLAYIHERFVLMYDDIIFLQPLGVEYLSRRLAMNEMTPGWAGGVKMHKHNAILRDTEKALRDKGVKRVWNYETHLPRVFEKRKMMEVIELFKPDENRLMLPTLYFNWHFKNQPPTLISPMDDTIVRFAGASLSPFDTLPAPTEGERAIQYYKDKMKGKHIMNWDNRGINHSGLQFTRHSMFPDPCFNEYTGTKNELVLEQVT